MKTPLILLSKPDCGLCHEMEDVVRRVIGDALELVVADVRSKEGWRRYRVEIPVLLLGDQEVARHRTSEHALRQRLSFLGVTL